MEGFDYYRIQEHFLRITGLKADEFDCGGLIEYAAKRLELTLNADISQLDGIRLDACEYAAAADAAFDHAFEECLRARAVMSENGEIHNKRADETLIEAAMKLRLNAHQRLVSLGLCKPESFAFIGV